ncbi:MAG: HEAT repeat domain-containing protein [bacterium]
MKKILIVLCVFFFYPSLSYSGDSLEIAAPPPLTSWVYSIERKGGQDFLSKLLPKGQGKIPAQAYVIDALPDGKILLSSEKLGDQKITSEGWYAPLQSALYVPWGNWTRDFKFEEKVVKGLGEIGNVSKPDLKITVKCRIEGQDASQTRLECIRYMESLGRSLLTATMGSEEKILATYSHGRKVFTKMEVLSKNDMGLFGNGSSRLLLTLNEKESESRTQKLRQVFGTPETTPAKSSLSEAQKQSPTFESVLGPGRQRQEKLAEDFKKSFAKEGATLEQLKAAKNDEDFMKVGHALLLTADPPMIHKIVPVLIEMLKEEKEKPNEKGWTGLLIRQWLPALTFQYLGEDPAAWDQWWRQNKGRSFDEWAALSAETNPTPLLRVEALKRLKKAKRKEDIPLLKKLLKEEREEISVLAAAALADQKDKSGLPRLIEALDSPNAAYRDLAFVALENFSDRTLGYDPALSYLDRRRSVSLWKAWLEENAAGASAKR